MPMPIEELDKLRKALTAAIDHYEHGFTPADAREEVEHEDNCKVLGEFFDKYLKNW